jgi:hypothetical protein
MSKKTLLNESQIRSFMKLAKLEPLTPGFVQGLTESTDDLDEGRKTKKTPMREEEETVEEGMGGMYRDEDEMDESHGNGKLELNGVDDGLGRKRDRAGMMEQEEMEVDEPEMRGAAGDEMDDEEMDAEMDAEVEAPVEAPAADAGKMVSVDDFLSALERALEDAMGEEVEITDEMDDEVADDEPADDMTDEPEDDEMGDDDDALMESITKRVAKRILMEALSAKK